MMQGRFKEYNWNDIEQLIYKDCGLNTGADQRTKGQIWCIGGFAPPQYPKDTIIRAQVFDKEYSERLEEHCKDVK